MNPYLLIGAVMTPAIVVDIIWIVLHEALGVVDYATQCAGMAVGNFAFAVLAAVAGLWVCTAVLAGCGLWLAYDWWRNRRGGKWKRAVKELGAKSKARVDALVRQMTPSPIPSRAGAS